MIPIVEYPICAMVALATAGTVFVLWLVTRRRIAADTIGRAEEQAARLLRDAERDAESRQKELLLDARVKAHDLVTDAERLARQERQQSQALEQLLIKRESELAERLSTSERTSRELQTGDRALAAREQQAESSAFRYQQLVAQQQHELERVASLTADDAKELLLKQIEADARHDAANLVKRLDAEARETAGAKAKQYITEAIRLSHSAEVARLAGIMAREVGLDAQVAVRAAFVHDIGKAIDREMQGTHLEIGIDFLRKHGENEAVVMAMAAHHMDIDWPSLEAMIVQAADAISAARPGARRDILESYVKRLEKLEGIADSFKGVSKSFALQAGREIRIMVESEKISDEDAVWLSKDIARRIENELEYPGQIKVTVIRETRAVDYAK